MIRIDSPDSPYYPLMKNKNNELRTQIINSFMDIKDEREKIIAIKEFFAKHYDYDYGYIFGNNPSGIVHDKPTCEDREYRTFTIDGKPYEAHSFTYRDCGKHLSPALHLTKVAQCTIYPNEMKFFMNNYGINSSVRFESSFPCLNKFTKCLVNIPHQFNKVYLKNGKTLSVDICAEIMTRDAKRMNLDIDYKALQATNTEI